MCDPGPTTETIVSTCTGQCHKNVQWPGTESQADRPQERTGCSWGVVQGEQQREPIVSACTAAWVQNVQRLGTESWVDRAWQEYTLVCFCVLRALQLLPLHTSVWSWIWGEQILGEVCHSGSPGPQLQHSHLDLQPQHTGPHPSILHTTALH